MEDDELIRRCADLYERCDRTSSVTSTRFLTPAESFEASRAAKACGWENAFFSGGREGCERTVLFFLPGYMQPEELDVGEYISCIRADTKFSEPGHRDYLGSLMGLGISRDCIGDIMIQGETGCFFCLRSVEEHILMNLTRIGRGGAKLCRISGGMIPEIHNEYKNVVFTVKSPRLDAVTAGMFGISRTAAAEQIASGLVSLNYSVCMRGDAPVSGGDIISLRGKGKGRLREETGRSRKDRLFISADIYK